MKIAFMYYHLSSFVRQDLEILSRHFQVDAVHYRNWSDIPKIVAAIWKSDAIFSWFASGHSFLAVLCSRLFGKRSVVVAGGYDVAFVPEINYGQYTLGRLKRIYSNYVLKNADEILAVSQFTKSELLARARPRRAIVVYNAIDSDKFLPEGEKEELVMTIASGLKDVIRLKGLDTFVEAAEYHPRTKFLILGLSDEDRKDLAGRCKSDNIELGGYICQEDLIGNYQRSKVYCQLSYRESFGVALAEAMACECVPVVTDRGALREVVGDTGFYVPYGDEKAVAEAIKKALKSDNGDRARKRIVGKFSLLERERALVKTMDFFHD
ncbi:MAG TPA: glycosyltransferase family 4 protein [Methanothrix sp.]|nr:glycosyltransferase family 4 protein [Methanothrix sp.]